MRFVLAPILLLALPLGCGGGAATTDAATGRDAGASIDASADVGATTDAGTVDASVATDTATVDAARIADGVVCGSSSCAIGDVCCQTASGSSCAAPASGCLAEIACDGPEDCPMGGAPTCCGDGGGGASCTPCFGGELICHVDRDCMTAQSCCPIGGALPYGALMHCVTLAPGDPCPAPP